jgi:hypothetical protein
MKISLMERKRLHRIWHLKQMWPLFLFKGDKEPILCPSDRGICRFTIQDFYPGAAAPHPRLRQSLGEYEAWLHNCGEPECPFQEVSLEDRQRALQAGYPIPSDLSPGDHIRVDPRAFRIPIHVKVPAQVLGIDSSL